MFRITSFLTAVVLVVGQTEAATFQGLGDLPGGDFSSVAYDVSADGSTVVGESISDAGVEAFSWTAATSMVDFGGAASPPSGAAAVSANGNTVVGWRHFDSIDYAYRWVGTAPDMSASVIDPFNSRATDISADGSAVVGFDTGGAGPNGWFRPWSGSVANRLYLYSQNNWLDSKASAISGDGRIVVGEALSLVDGNVIDVATLWDISRAQPDAGGMLGTSLGRLGTTGNDFSRALGISADGSTVVGQSEGPLGPEAFRWTQSTGMVGLGDLPGGSFDSLAWDASADGSRVVGFGSFDTGLEAFIWDETNGMRSIQDMLTDDYGLDLSGWTLGHARGISDDGTVIVGFGDSPSGRQAWMAVVPEPSTLILLTIGTVGLLAYRWRRRRLA